MSRHDSYPPIADYGLISDGRSAALVSRRGSIDWCCMPRLDAGSCFGRLLDWDRGGFCSIEPTADDFTSFRSYIDETMVLSTPMTCQSGEARIIDCLTLPSQGKPAAPPRLLRVIEGLRGQVQLRIRVSPRFDYGEVRPWLRYHGRKLHSAVGGNDGLLVAAEVELERMSAHDLEVCFTVAARERVRLSIQYVNPTAVERPGPPEAAELDRELEHTLKAWRAWSRPIHAGGQQRPGVVRSALALKALANPQTGAIAAAATTSLPESPGGGRNWDYRFSWVRDSTFSVRALSGVGCFKEANAFRRFVEISAAGAAEDLQIMYGMGGERRLTEIELPLQGYRGAQPVRAGNAAAKQRQIDVYGELVELAWRCHEQGESPDDDHWRFLLDLVEAAVASWREPGRGLWESRGEPQHYVHSKVMLWSAVDKGLRLAEDCLRKAPVERWRKAREEIRTAVEKEGYDSKRNTFVRAFGSKDVDASLLLLPAFGFVDYKDPRMLGTVDAVREELDAGGLIQRYKAAGAGDGVKGTEGAFVACTFWLAECLAYQGRLEEARETFGRALATGNDLGLFSEEYDTRRHEMLGNLPQALSHLSHISAAVALMRFSHDRTTATLAAS